MPSNEKWEFSQGELLTKNCLVTILNNNNITGTVFIMKPAPRFLVLIIKSLRSLKFSFALFVLELLSHPSRGLTKFLYKFNKNLAWLQRLTDKWSKVSRVLWDLNSNCCYLHLLLFTLVVPHGIWGSCKVSHQ